jgi:hypothetical protein
MPASTTTGTTITTTGTEIHGIETITGVLPLIHGTLLTTDTTTASTAPGMIPIGHRTVGQAPSVFTMAAIGIMAGVVTTITGIVLIARVGIHIILPMLIGIPTVIRPLLL